MKRRNKNRNKETKELTLKVKRLENELENLKKMLKDYDLHEAYLKYTGDIALKTYKKMFNVKDYE